MTTPRRNRVDLHAHTSRSDGVLAPAALVAAMRDWGTRLAGITDHDTLDGYRELRAAGEGVAGPRLIAGVEINGIAHDVPDLWDGELHILGYGVDPDDPEFEAALARQRELRGIRVALILERLRSLGTPVDRELATILGPGVRSPGRPHIARALVAAGHAESVDDAMTRILARGAPGYVPRQGLGPREAIEAIHAAGGLASLAHFREALDRPDVVERLRVRGLDGIESYHSSFDAETRRRMTAFAARHGLLATGGSDFHGDTWSYADAQRETHVPDEVGAALLAALGRPPLDGLAGGEPRADAAEGSPGIPR